MKKTILAALVAAVTLALAGTAAAQGGSDAGRSIFLCYSTYQVMPGVWSQFQGTNLYENGYWLPDAVKGNVAGGDNVGDYHLVCNSGGTPTGTYLTGWGGTIGADIAKGGMSYPIVS